MTLKSFTAHPVRQVTRYLRLALNNNGFIAHKVRNIGLPQRFTLAEKPQLLVRDKGNPAF